MAPSIGRKKKRKGKPATGSKGKEVTPDAPASSPSKELFSTLILETKFLDKASKFDRLTKSITALLERVCDDADEMREFALCLYDSIKETPVPLSNKASDTVASPSKLPPQTAIVRPVQQIKFNLFAFRPGRTPQAARQQKKRKVDSLLKCLTNIGTAQQQLLCLFSFLSKFTTKPNANPVVVGAVDALSTNSIAGKIGNNALQMLSYALTRTNTKDRMSFIRTLLMAMATADVPDNRFLSKMSRMIGYRRRNLFTRAFKQAISARKELLSSHNGALVQHSSFKRRTLFTPAYIQHLHNWILHKCDLVVASPSQKESVLVKDLFTGEKKRVQKHYYVSSVQELHNELIKPEEMGGFDGARNNKATDVEKEDAVAAEEIRTFVEGHQHPRDYIKGIGEHEAANSRLIQPENFGAYGAGDDYYIVKWTTDAFPLEEDSGGLVTLFWSSSPNS